MKTNGSKTYYFSAFKNNLTAAQNLDRHSELRHKLTRLGYSKQECIGVYKGNPELTFLVCNNLGTTEEDIINLAKEYQQESILIVYGDNQDAEIVYTGGLRIVIGKFKCIGGEDGVTTEPLNGRDYTYYNNKYYIVE
jgi:hypothetical protein